MTEYAYRRAEWVTPEDFIKIDADSDEEAIEWGYAHQEFFPDGPVEIFKREAPEQEWHLIEDVRQEDLV